MGNAIGPKEFQYLIEEFLGKIDWTNNIRLSSNVSVATWNVMFQITDLIFLKMKFKRQIQAISECDDLNAILRLNYQ